MAAIILAVLTGVLWAVGELLSKSVFHSGQIGPITAIAVRGTVALPLLWGAWVVARFVVRAPGEQASVFAAEPVVLWKLVGASLLAGGL
ncbi:MAG TPA: hypothetical protein VD963_02705, partial [Phycisphaerales bacterium]|nr:hypothetical protein [Phycisphaerales bacterium]